MSDTEYTPLQTIEFLEAAAFRVGQVWRRLRANHPDLPVSNVRPSVYANERDTTSRLEISPDDVDAVRAWAEALGTTVDIRFHDGAGSHAHCFEYHHATVTVSGVEVSFAATRWPTEEEAAAWRAKRDQAAEAGGPA
ncbi:hypothetical protein [Streptomyces sp. NBC_01262]|uniref:hypothetical protein n=1 Tax=Streptomyces sp. NBC_01262 TaxID=2903803 RepID=UPI002E37DB77|nr:hypothetical protein [Streptomyces sp. NBC_01262]